MFTLLSRHPGTEELSEVFTSSFEFTLGLQAKVGLSAAGHQTLACAYKPKGAAISSQHLVYYSQKIFYEHTAISLTNIA